MMNKAFQYIIGVCAVCSLAACDSSEAEFPDFERTSVYFANQYVDRTLELGNDEWIDTSRDNQRLISIQAATGGGYDNRQDITIPVAVDASLCTGLEFANGGAVTPMPENYYMMKGNSITIPAGRIQGGVEIELTDAFFADPLSRTTHYVIPLRMTGVAGADSILANRNFVLYGVKYVNPWHATYLRRGVDQIQMDGTTKNNVRHTQHVEQGETVNLTTGSLTTALMPFSIKDAEGHDRACQLQLAFTNDGACTVSSLTEGFTASGQGRFVTKGEKQALGGKDADALYLDYTVSYSEQGITYATRDTMVVQTRGIKPSYFQVR